MILHTPVPWRRKKVFAENVMFRDEQYESPSILMAKVKAMDFMQKNIKLLSLLENKWF